VLDPFFGTGTTGVVAKRLGRHYVGIERDPAYAGAALERLDQTETGSGEAVKVSAGKRAEVRVPFGSLVEAGLIAPGEVLTCPLGRQAATVRADGTIASADASGSIHKIAAHVQRLEAANGWTFWHARVKGKLVPIDLYRQEMRARMAQAGA